MRNLAALGSVAVAYLLLRGQPEAWPPLVRACVAVVCLFAGLGWRAAARRESGVVLASRRRATWLDSVALGAVVLAVEVGFVGFFRVMPEPLETAAAGVEAWLRPEASERRRLEEEREAAARTGNWLWQREGERPLPRRTNFKPGNRPEVFLRPAEDGGRLLESRIYVHAFALGEYRKGVWSPGGGEFRVRRADPDGWVRLVEPAAGAAVEYRIYLGHEPSGQNPLVGLQGLLAARVPELREKTSGYRLLPELGPEDGGREYDALSQPLTLDGIDPATEAAADAPDRYLAPAEGVLGERIARFTEAVSGEGPAVERLRRIRNHLRTTLDYSLVTENAGDRDPVENFLFVEQRGHCEYFATAGALMARAAGVPARICYGWAGGTYYEGSRLFVFRSREAHAWTEVLLDGIGWVVLDPTPPSGFQSARAELAPPGAAPPGLDGDAVGAVDEPGGGMGWVLGLAVLAGLPALLLWPLRKSRPEQGAGRAGEGRGGYAGMFGAACRRRGLRCFRGRTLRSLVESLDERPGFADELLAYHYAVRYEGAGRDREVERRLEAGIRAWDAPVKPRDAAAAAGNVSGGKPV